ncbi:MAG: hypothetical protein HC880_00535, partial [Bacteroidia bacterium]|nr:hypothetical protein [Bacteroidia bacterium]
PKYFDLEGQPFKSVIYLTQLLLFGALSLLSLSPAYCQNYPIQAQVQLVPPYSAFLPDMVSPGAEKLRLVLTQRDLTRTDLAVRLEFRLERDGRLMMRSRQGLNLPPIQLLAGVPLILSGADLAPYLDDHPPWTSPLTMPPSTNAPRPCPKASTPSVSRPTTTSGPMCQ